jgi:cytidylate kinase
MIITVDGPTASGKGSLARALAEERGYYYVDTGSLYRAIGYAVSKHYSKDQVRDGAFWSAEMVTELAGHIRYAYEDGAAVVYFDGEDVTSHLRTPEIDWYASHVSREPLVRDGLKQMQRDLGGTHNIVIDGRDCGTVIFPGADHKFYLTAALDVRVNRSYNDACRKAHTVSKQEMRSAVLGRDLRDLTRTLSPLRPADDAVIIDSTHLNFEQTCELVRSYLVG